MLYFKARILSFGLDICFWNWSRLVTASSKGWVSDNQFFYFKIELPPNLYQLDNWINIVSSTAFGVTFFTIITMAMNEWIYYGDEK